MMKFPTFVLVLAAVCSILEAAKLDMRASKRHHLSRSQRQPTEEEVEQHIQARSGSFQIHSNLEDEHLNEIKKSVHHQVKSHLHQARISNGVEADRKSTRSMVIVVFYNRKHNETNFAQGALLDAGFAVTASVAAFHFNDSVTVPALVATGVYDVSKKDSNVKFYTVTEYVFLYSNKTQYKPSGVLLLNLNTTTYDNDAKSIDLPSNNSMCASNTAATVYGWGRTSNEDKTNVTTPKQAQVLVKDQEVCRNALMDGDKQVYDDLFLCTTDPNNSGICYDDAGAPLETVDKSGNTTLIGLGFWRQNCNDKSKPSYYINMCSYADMIVTMQWYIILSNGIIYFIG